MVKKIVKGRHIFASKTQPATEADRQVMTDLLDTLKANREIKSILIKDTTREERIRIVQEGLN